MLVPIIQNYNTSEHPPPPTRVLTPTTLSSIDKLISVLADLD